MAKYGNNYGPGGSNRDEFGELPPKRIESMRGVEVASTSPISPRTLSDEVREFYRLYHRKPTRYIYPGQDTGTAHMGVIIDGIGYVSVDFKNVPNAQEARLE